MQNYIKTNPPYRIKLYWFQHIVSLLLYEFHSTLVLMVCSCYSLTGSKALTRIVGTESSKEGLLCLYELVLIKCYIRQLLICNRCPEIFGFVVRI